MEWLAILMFFTICGVLLLGYPVAFSLAGVAIIFAGIGAAIGAFDPDFLGMMPYRFNSIINNQILIAVPLFVFMGVMLERSKIAEHLLTSMGALFGRFPGGLGISVLLVGALLAASTGIIGATVVTMGLITLPSMLKRGYDPKLATGTICATGTLGQIIPPSIALIILGDVLANAQQEARNQSGSFEAINAVSVPDLFMGALIPGFLLVFLYGLYLTFTAWRHPERAPAASDDEQFDKKELLTNLLPPLVLILAVLGSILGGIASPTEAAGVGALGATLMALVKGVVTKKVLHEVSLETLKVTSMVFMIFIGAAIFSLVFRGYGGDDLVQSFFNQLPGGAITALLFVMLIIFLLGFILDFIEITFVVVPIVAPVLLAMGIDPILLGIMIAINLQTSFLTPPFGFALFYLRGVAPKEVLTADIYRGVIPFIVIQVIVLIALLFWPEIATWLPHKIYG